jgi:CheY-like chemotaxis protein
VRILIVDDSQAMTAIVRRSVMAAGIELLEIETAKSGAEALDCLQRFQPDLVLTDWHMPGMSGLEMVQNMRQLGFTDTHVGFITTEAKPELMAESKRNGADFFLNKPFRDEELWEHLHKLSAELAKKAPPGKPVLLDALTVTTKGLIKLIPFRLVEQQMTPSDLSDMNLLALYTYEGSKSPMAIGVLDIHSVIMVGAGALAMQPADVKKFMISNKPTAEMQAQSAKFMGMVAGLMKTPVDAPVTMLKQSLVSRDFPKLQELLKRNRGASFFRIDIPGYGIGRMGFILV